MSKIIKIGPIHSVFESPFTINLEQDGDRISDVNIEIGYSHRGIEGLALQKTYLQTLELVERSCGLCSHTHASCFCQAVEKIAGLKVPPRAQNIRIIISELERIHSHLFWAGMVSGYLGFDPFKSYILTIREGVMEMLEAISGNRVMFSINTFGGVRRDITNEKDVKKLIESLEKPINKMFEEFDTNTEIIEKTRKVGILTKKDALSLGVVGPTARTAGIKMDIRKDHPYDGFERMKFKTFTHFEGDTYARVLIRFEEIKESMNIIKQALSSMPKGPIVNKLSGNVPQGEAIGQVEAPRGELFYFVKSDGSQFPKRVKIRVPTFANLPAVRNMLLGEKSENLNLVLGSIDPCFSCLER